MAFFMTTTQGTQDKQLQRASAPFPLPEMLSGALEFFKALVSSLQQCLTTHTLEKSGLLPDFMAFSRLEIGQLSTPRLATLSWATAAYFPYVNALSCWATALALFRLLSFLPAVANKTHLEHGQYVQEHLGVSEHKGWMFYPMKTQIFMAMKREPNV